MEDKSKIQFVKNLRLLGFSNSKIAKEAGYTISELREKLSKPEFAAEINNNLASFVEILFTFLNYKIEPVRTPRNKLKASSMRSAINAKAAMFWLELVSYQYKLTKHLFQDWIIKLNKTGNGALVVCEDVNGNK